MYHVLVPTYNVGRVCGWDTFMGNVGGGEEDVLHRSLQTYPHARTAACYKLIRLLVFKDERHHNSSIEVKYI